MSEFHYTVIYDDKVKAWFVESDDSAYYPDGNVYDRNAFPGWFVPEEGSPEGELDITLISTLQSIVSTFPIPEEVVSG